MGRPALAISLFLTASACTPVPMDPLRAADLCEERARAAQGPTGRLGVGVSSGSGPYADLEVGITGDFIAGRDPMEVYETCVRDKTGADPIRLPNLR